MVSLMIITSPGSNSGFTPPQAFVSTSVSIPMDSTARSSRVAWRWLQPSYG